MKQISQKVEQTKRRFGIIGNSPVLNHAIEMAIQVANTDMSVLLVGENGTGKELFFKIIHHLSIRRHGKLIAVNCGAIPEGTINSELFGHEKGSFTSASDTRKGYFEEANKGTIFLDELGELPLHTQPILLRVLENNEYMRVGSSHLRKTDVRVVSATNINLEDYVRKGKFREDLFYRIAQVRITIPPLRERGDDIYLLFRKFAMQFAEMYGTPLIQLGVAAKERLLQYDFPGNVRQLKNITWQIATFESGSQSPITKEVLERYLPVTPVPANPLVLSNTRKQSSYNEEFIYQTLLQMQKDIQHIKSVVFPTSSNALKAHKRLGTYADFPTDVTFLNQIDIQKPLLLATSKKETMKKQLLEKEDLSLNAHIERLVSEAISRTKSIKEAAKELGVSERTVHRWLKKKRMNDQLKNGSKDALS
ncbi:MAG: sigma 54-interacting transcriptional regulator [Cytophagales bacterium]